MTETETYPQVEDAKKLFLDANDAERLLMVADGVTRLSPELTHAALETLARIVRTLVGTPE